MLYYKINANLTPRYLKTCIDNCPLASTSHFKNYFFPYCKRHWDLLPADTKSISTYGKFKANLQRSVRPAKSPSFGIDDVSGLKLLTQLRLGLNDLRAHRFRHGFINCPSPICACGREEESTSHFLHRCPRFSTHREGLYSRIRLLDSGSYFFSLPLDDFTTVLLYGMKKLTACANKLILEATIDFIRKSKRFRKLKAFA